MLELRQPIFSIASAAVYTILGLLFGSTAIDGAGTTIAGLEIGPTMNWVACGLMFVMAYFSLVHLRHDH